MDTNVLQFVTYCVGALSINLGLSRNTVYRLLNKGGLIYDYIVPGYEVLHTFSRAYIVDDLKDMMRRKGVLHD